ncbi:MAG: HNH endonuclease [Lachnospiraceae bacterium]|nr:HNH endonuclease [Lachnospiraceae bacterium]
MMKDPSYCYKFYWLEAIVCLITQDRQQATFDDVINEMICNAWYSVREFHIHLSGLPADGEIRDGLERTVNLLTELSKLPANASKEEIRNAIKENDGALKQYKEQLTNMVPYRALSGFFGDDVVKWESLKWMISFINETNNKTPLPYTLGESSKLKKEIYFNPAWMKMIQDNAFNILGWIQYNKLEWLQKNNPEVPGLVYKLKPLDEKERKLAYVRKLWEGIMKISPVTDVFTGKPIEARKYDVDHFIPWSFVMNDELWNLMPMDSSLNNSKSNKLPKWDPFFEKFANNQFILYQQIHDKPGIHKLFESCYRDNLHSIWAGQELYRKGNSKTEFCNILQKNMQPVYDSARRQGYEVWNRVG